MGGGGGPGREIPEQVIQDALNNGEDFTLEENDTTNLTENLIIPEGRTLTNNGTIDLGESGLEITGNLINNGTITNQAAGITVLKTGEIANFSVININGTIVINTDGSFTFTNKGEVTAQKLEVIGDDPEVSITLHLETLETSKSFYKIDNIINNGAGEFNISIFPPSSTRDPFNPSAIISKNIETNSPTTFKGIDVLTDSMTATDSLTLDDTSFQSLDQIIQVKSLNMKNDSFYICTNGFFGGDETFEVKIDTSSTFLIGGSVVIKSNIINQGKLKIRPEKLLQLNNNTLENTGTIENNGTIRQFSDSNPSIEANSFGKIITTGTVTGLNLKNQQINTTGNGTVIAGTKNEDGKILNATAKTIEWDANYNPGDEDEDYKVKRIPLDDSKFEIEFVTDKVKFLKEGVEVTLPNGVQPYSTVNNPGFTLDTWYKQHDGVDGEPNVFGILA